MRDEGCGIRDQRLGIRIVFYRLMPLVLQARQLSKRFGLRHNAGDLKIRALALVGAGARARREEFWAARSSSLRIDAGASLAPAGRNGPGRATYLSPLAAHHRRPAPS